LSLNESTAQLIGVAIAQLSTFLSNKCGPVCKAPVRSSPEHVVRTVVVRNILNLSTVEAMSDSRKSVAGTLWPTKAIFPRVFTVRQNLVSDKVKDVPGAVRDELERVGLERLVKPGWNVCVTAGSRGISCYLDIVRTVIEELKRIGAKPFVIPAMGSHGGATSRGQVDVLAHLGITSKLLGAPIVASMEVEEIGRLEDGAPVLASKYAIKADAIIVVNRVKPHTDFKDEIESGLMKMMVIGLGKAHGARLLHSFRGKGYHRYLRLMARLIMQKTPVVLGLAVMENGYHEISTVKAILPEHIEEQEKRLLVEAKKTIPRLPFHEIDVLIVDEIGKNISGMGMDTNVTGRFWIPGEGGPDLPRIDKIVVRGITEESDGNAIGIGLADYITEHAFRQIDLHKTYVNSLTAGWPEIARIPVIFPNDRDAIFAALQMSTRGDTKKARLVRIRNTLSLGTLDISETLAEEVGAERMLQEKLEIVSTSRSMRFDKKGTLMRTL